MTKQSPPSLDWLAVSDAQLRQLESLPPSPPEAATDDFIPPPDPSDVRPSEELPEDQDPLIGAKRIARFQHQNEQFSQQSGRPKRS